MKQLFENLWKDFTVSSVVTVIAGILIAVFHSVAMDIVCIALGLASAVIGLFCIIRYIREPLALNRLNLLIGLVLGAIGIYIICHPAVLINIVAVVFGILILYHGIVDLQQTFSLKKSGYPYWTVALVFSLLILVAGIVLILLKKEVVNSLTLLLGIILAVEGFMNLWMAMKVRRING